VDGDLPILLPQEHVLFEFVVAGKISPKVFYKYYSILNISCLLFSFVMLLFFDLLARACKKMKSSSLGQTLAASI
jgi:hypothetical protein